MNQGAPEQPTQLWDATQYAANGRFVADLATEIVDWLAVRPGERVLDLGCGDGALTQVLAGMGARVTGVELDSSMSTAARARGIHVEERSMTDLRYVAQFDAVFSNAALHWVRDQAAVLRGVRAALVPGGRFVAEMGGLANIAGIRVALCAVCSQFGVNAEEVAASYFPSADDYAALLRAAGFHVERMELAARPTLVKAGMAEWLQTFRRAVLLALPADARDVAVRQTVAMLRPALQDSSGTWWADYVRLRFVASKRD